MGSKIIALKSDEIELHKKGCISQPYIVTGGKSVDGPYAKYVLVVLMIVYVFNFIDRQILAILAEDIKADLGISDADLGFLFGTAFAVFYATFGIALGRLADIWNRKKLITLGLGFWSLMTVLSGFTRGFFPLAVCRFGVGVGEASASPAAFSILYDYFSSKVRTTALAVYSSGVYIGGGLGLLLGGAILDAWNNTWPNASLAPFGLKGWQAAFMIVGLPGFFMAFWVSTLREPVRGQSDDIISTQHPYPFREAFTILVGMLPVCSIWILVKVGGRRGSIIINIVTALSIILITYSLVQVTNSTAQWTALGVGIFAVVSWAQALAVRDPVIFGMIFKCRALLSVIFALGTTTFVGVALPFWSVPFFQRYYDIGSSEIGSILGLAGAIMGFCGIVLGGVLADRLKTRTPRGKLYVMLAAVIVSILSAIVFLSTSQLTLAYVGISVLLLAISMAHGPAVSTINDLVLPRGRATTSAFAFIITTFVGIALGPYITGHISDNILATGVSSGEALRQAMLWSLLIPVVGVTFVLHGLKHIETDEKNLLDRARDLGEIINH